MKTTEEWLYENAGRFTTTFLRKLQERELASYHQGMTDAAEICEPPQRHEDDTQWADADHMAKVLRDEILAARDKKTTI